MSSANIPVTSVRLDDNEIITNDIILPSQFWGVFIPEATPEMRLVSAVLVDAINCYLGSNVHRKAQALEWFTSRQSGAYTFWDCCQWLNINSEHLWQHLRAFELSGRRVKRIKGNLIERRTSKKIGGT